MTGPSDLRTLRACFAEFKGRRSPQIIGTSFGLTLVGRLAATAWASISYWDLIAVAIVISCIPFAEWLIHKRILHLNPLTLGNKRIDLGAGHRRHHDCPSEIRWVLLEAPKAVVFQVIVALSAMLVATAVIWPSGAPLAGPSLTAALAGIAGLLHYEWAHFLFHSVYQPKTGYYRRLKANHRLHHWRDQSCWLGITSNLADRTFRTYR